MKSNIVITDNVAQFTDYRIVQIDGEKAITLRGFYEELGKALDFPDYFGFNLDSLDELMNDLSWVKESKILVYISKSALFVSKERNPEKLETLLDMLDATCEDWKWEDEDESHGSKKEVLIAFDSSERIQQLLDKIGINFETLS